MASALVKKIIPLGDRVLVKRVVAQTKTAGGIFLPEAAMKKEIEGEVISVGPGLRTKDGNIIPMTVATGDRVLLPEYGGHTIDIGGQEYQLFRNDDILGKFTN